MLSAMPTVSGTLDTRRAVAARENATNKPPPIGTASVSTNAPPKAKPTVAPAKKDPKKSLKGVLVKKKSKPAPSDAKLPTSKQEQQTSGDTGADGDERETKRRRVSAS